MSTNLWVWFMGLGMLALFSFVYKENPFYRLFEHIYVGAAAGYTVVVNYGAIVDRAIKPLAQQGAYNMIIPIALGLLLYTRYFKKISYLSRWSIAFLLGIGVGISTAGLIQSQLIAQVRAGMMNLLVYNNGAFVLGRSLNNIIMFLGTMSVILYFFFSVQQKGLIKHGSVLGRYVMMITFGVAFGNVVMGRISLLLGAMEDIFGKWLGLL
ncbi:MAG: hypothetical protein KGZ53_01490 [Peptococcaceae bacterium]|nr:hypothetical protein [Peptococcaceae bacterium]